TRITKVLPPMPATDKYLRNLKTVHVVFAFSALGLLIATIWMMAADHADPWRKIQQTNYRIDAERTRAELNAVESNQSYVEKKQTLDAELAQAEQNVDAKKAEIEQAEAGVKEAKRAADLTERAAK